MWIGWRLRRKNIPTYANFVYSEPVPHRIHYECYERNSFCVRKVYACVCQKKNFIKIWCELIFWEADKVTFSKIKFQKNFWKKVVFFFKKKIFQKWHLFFRKIFLIFPCARFGPMRTFSKETWLNGLWSPVSGAVVVPKFFRFHE